MQAADEAAIRGRFVPASPNGPLIGAMVALALLYYLGAKAGFALTPQRLPISMLWPPNALVLSVLLLFPVRQWGWLIAAVFPAHMLAEMQAGVPTTMVLGWFASNCSEALIGAGATVALLGRARAFDSFRQVGLLLLCVGLLAPLASSFLDAGMVKLFGWTDTGYWQLMRVRTASNALAAITIVPLVLTWAQGAPRLLGRARHRYFEAASLFAGLVATSILVFSGLEPDAHDVPALFYAPLPFMLWAAVRLGPMGITAALALMTAIATTAVVDGHGPFVGNSPEDNASAVQLFLIAASVPLLLLTALLEERRRVERETREQRQQLTHLSRVATIGGLSGALAHELNQPLTAILANAQAAQQLLSTGSMDAQELNEILSDIAAADRRAAEVIRRLRVLLKNGELDLQPVNLNEIVRESLDLAHGDFAMRHVRVVTELAPRLPSVRSDRVQLQQVLLNLALNACEAMSSGAVEHRVLTVRSAATAAGGVQISFIDRGPGFGEAEAERLFEPFYTTKAHGLGLGLSISRSIVAAHGGRLWANSANGAAFHITLPPERAPFVQ